MGTSERSKHHFRGSLSSVMNTVKKVLKRPAIALGLATPLVAAIGALDYFTGQECQVVALYLLPVSLVVWVAGRRWGMAFSLLFFIIYWIFLISGEEFADRGFLSPALSMWLPNLILGPLGLFMCYRHAQEQRFLNLDFLNMFKRRNRK